MKATEQHVTVMLFIVQYEVGLTFKVVDEIVMCNHSNKSLLVSVFIKF